MCDDIGADLSEGFESAPDLDVDSGSELEALEPAEELVETAEGFTAPEGDMEGPSLETLEDAPELETLSGEEPVLEALDELPEAEVPEELPEEAPELPDETPEQAGAALTPEEFESIVENETDPDRLRELRDALQSGGVSVETAELPEEEEEPYVLRRSITPEILEGRERDTEDTLDGYRENLRDRGVGEERIEEFVSQEREKINAEYESLDHGDTSSNIYHMPMDWDSVASGMSDGGNDAPPSLSEALDDPELFENNEAGEYTYLEDELGKNAFGSLEMTDDPRRDPAAQRSVGGESRRPDDDGGHLIGARFGGEGGYENLDAQNRSLNRGSYKRMENGWADSLDEGGKVFVNVETYKGEGADRPEAYMGYSVTEGADGRRGWDAFSFQNENPETQDAWAAEIEAMGDIKDDIPNAMEDENYAELQSLAHEYEDKGF